MNGDQRPGGWVNGIGWVALLPTLPTGATFRWTTIPDREWVVNPAAMLTEPDNLAVIVTRWADGTTPTAPSDDHPEYRRGYRKGYNDGYWKGSTERGARKAVTVSVPKLRELAVHGGSDGVPSVDVCGFCSDSECDGIACIAAQDPDDTADHEAIERLHTLLRAGHALLAATEGGAS